MPPPREAVSICWSDESYKMTPYADLSRPPPSQLAVPSPHWSRKLFSMSSPYPLQVRLPSRLLGRESLRCDVVPAWLRWWVGIGSEHDSAETCMSLYAPCVIIATSTAHASDPSQPASRVHFLLSHAQPRFILRLCFENRGIRGAVSRLRQSTRPRADADADAVRSGVLGRGRAGHRLP